MKSSTSRIREHLGLEEAIRAIHSGSMWPTIRPGDSIRFRRSGERPRIGEIWVAEVGGIHVVHRVILVGAGSAVLFKGDWRLAPDGWIPRAALFGPVNAVRKGEHWRATNRRRDRLLGMAVSAVASAILFSSSAKNRVCRELERL